MSRVAIVTGSGRGIGKGYAEALAEHDHRVVIADKALSTSGITVNAIAPGMTVTEAILARFSDEDQGHEFAAKFTEENVPMGRPATVEDLANTLLFLVSDAASYVTAQTLAVDGGWLNRI